MNVFACDTDPKIAAQSLADRHVVKMVLETAQIISTVASTRGIDLGYRPTHKNHPVVRAASIDPHYLSWVMEHGIALAEEYQYRYNKVHKSLKVILAGRDALDTLSPSLSAAPMCMPEELRVGTVTEAYRRYLNVKYETWGTKAKWRVRMPPSWLGKMP